MLCCKNRNRNGWPRAPILIGLNVLIITEKDYFRCSMLPNVDGIKIFDKDDQAAQHHLNVLWPGQEAVNT